jgi:hypothetical protein
LLGFVHCGFARAEQIFSRRAVLLGGKRFSVPMNDVPMFACGFFHQPLKFLAPAAAPHFLIAILPLLPLYPFCRYRD